MPAPLADGIDYREAYGLLLFDCQPLRATLSPESCAAQWNKNAEGSACQGCTVGAVHSGAAPCDALTRATNKRCIRCGKADTRLLGGVLCLPCYNRSTEVLQNKNRKGAPPRKWASRLRLGCAIVQPRPGTKIGRTLRHRLFGCAIPRFEHFEKGAIWFEFLTLSDAELRTAIDRVFPGAEIVDCGLSPVAAC